VSGESIVLRAASRKLADAVVPILEEEHPMTLRQLFYRCISAGLLANSPKEYKKLGSLMTRLREAKQVPMTWIVDHIRATLKPSSWSGLADFGDTVRRAYRKDFWSSLPHHVEVFVEKDAIAGTIQPVTSEYDIALRVCRGYSSLSFVGEIAAEWSRIRKPIFAYYIGDFDPSGFDLERDLYQKLERYSGKWADRSRDGYTSEDRLEECDDPMAFYWSRLAVKELDFQAHRLIPLPVKMSDNRAREFIRKYGNECAEVDALPPRELRQRIENSITDHIDGDRWSKLQETEQLEQESLGKFLDAWAQQEKTN
jgi:hypothetical protein